MPAVIHPSRILVCDHRGENLAASLTELEGLGFQLDRSASLRESLSRLEDDPPDAILLDPLSPRGSAELGAIDRARTQGKNGGERPPSPLLVLLEGHDVEGPVRAARSLKAGLWDVASRQARAEEIGLRLRRLLDQRQALLEMDELRHRASHDDRTDLLRPKAFQARLAEHFSAAQRHDHELALVLLDLDRFGAVNKRHDHTVGDELITRVGDAIRKTLRIEDVAGRLGGDEFAVLLPYTGPLNASLVVNRLRSEIKKLSGRIGRADEEVEVSASIGFETYNGKGKDLDSLDTLRAHAERALRVAKQRGGDQGVYFRGLGE
jgi:diguanylate cyclase (GGDEF)-like protein